MRWLVTRIRDVAPRRAGQSREERGMGLMDILKSSAARHPDNVAV
jgi:hypothetical protein